MCDYNVRADTALELKRTVFANSVERPDPQGLSTFSQCTEFPPYWGIKLTSSRSGVRHSTKWLASRMLVWVSAGFSTVLPPGPLCIAYGLGLVEKNCLLWRWRWTSESANDVPSECYISCDHVGVTTVKRPDPKGLFTLSQCTEFPLHWGIKLTPFRSEVRPSN